MAVLYLMLPQLGQEWERPTMPKTKRLIALDMGSNSVKAMEFGESGGILQATAFGYKTYASDAEKVQAATEVIETGRFRSKYAVSAIAGRNVITRYVVMRKLTGDELKDAIQFEADKYIPFGIDEVMLDCQKIEDVEGSDQMRVLLVAVKRNVIEDHINVIRQIGLESVIIDVEAFAIGNSFINSQRQDDVVTCALVDIGHSKTNIVVMTGSKTMFNREVYIGARELMEAVERNLAVDHTAVEQIAREPGDRHDELMDALSGPLDDLCNEVTLSFEFYENEYDRNIDSVWLSGGGAFIYDMVGEVENRLARSTHIWDPLKGVDLRIPVARTSESQEIARKLAVVTGLGTRIRKEI